MQASTDVAAQLLATFLAALEAALPAALHRQTSQYFATGSAADSSSTPAAAWRRRQAAQAAAAQLVDSLARLHGMGVHLAASCLPGADAAPEPALALAELLGQADAGSVAGPGGDGGPSSLRRALQGCLAAGLADGLLSSLKQAPAGSGDQQQHRRRQACTHRLLQQCYAACAAAAAAAAALAVPEQLVPAQQRQQPSAGQQPAGPDSIAQGCLGYAVGKLVAAHGASLPSPPPPAATTCMLHALTRHALSLAGAFAAATAPPPPAAPGSVPAAAAAASAWLRQRQAGGGLLLPDAGQLTHGLLTTAGALPPDAQLLLAQQLHAAAADLSGDYGTYAMLAPAGVLAAVDAGAVRGVLDRIVACSVALLGLLWRASEARLCQQQLQAELLQGAWAPGPAGGGGGAASSAGDAGPSHAGPGHASRSAAGGASSAAAEAGTASTDQAEEAVGLLLALSLSALAHLHFCAASQGLPSHAQLVGQLVQALAVSPGASQHLLHTTVLPCYAALLQPAPAAAAQQGAASVQRAGSTPPAAGSAGSQAPRLLWQADIVMAARLSFLVPLLPLVWRLAPEAQLQASAERILPLLLLLLQHPARQLSLAAHAAYASIASVGAEGEEEEGRSPAAAAAAAALVEQSAPLFLQRALGAFPAAAPVEGLQLVLHHLMSGARVLPPGSAVPLLAVARLTDRLVDLLLLEEPSGGSCPAEAGPRAQERGTPRPPALPAAAPASGAASSGASPADLPEAGQQLFALLQYLLLGACDRRQLPAMLRTVGGALTRLGSQRQGQRQRLLAALHASVLRCEDHSRKLHLVHWLQEASRL